MQTPPPSPSKSTRIIYLDYLRILACLGVFACHLWGKAIVQIAINTNENLKIISSECLGIHGDSLYKCGWQTLFILPNDTWQHFLFNCCNFIFGTGYQAVHLFFFLSGFGLTLSALMSEKKNGLILWLGFLQKRFFRLYPSYWIVLAIYLALNFFKYTSFLGLIKTYIKGAIFLDILPATWFVPILLQLYLLFPFLFYLIKKFSLKKFLLLSLLVKTISSAVIITVSLLVFNKLLGFGSGALAPGGIALTRLFEFSLGMGIAKLFVERGCSINVFTQFRQPVFIFVGFVLECLGLFLSLKFTAININGHSIPIGLFISDAVIGTGIFILSLNFVFIVHILFKKVNTVWIDQISNGTYEAYLLHGFLLGYFEILLITPALRLFNYNVSYFILCFLYLIFLSIFTVLTLSLGCYLLNCKSYLIKKWSLFFNS